MAESRATSDPTLRTVFTSDEVSIAGAWVVVRVAIDKGLNGAQVESLVRGIESSMRINL